MPFPTAAQARALALANAPPVDITTYPIYGTVTNAIMDAVVGGLLTVRINLAGYPVTQAQRAVTLLQGQGYTVALDGPSGIATVSW